MLMDRESSQPRNDEESVKDIKSSEMVVEEVSPDRSSGKKYNLNMGVDEEEEEMEGEEMDEEAMQAQYIQQ